MGRPNRILVDMGVYHIVSRGHNRCNLFHVERDYRVYKKILKNHREKFNYELYHYCLMPNHTHLLLRMLKGIELPHLMQGINQSYAKYYQRTYGLAGNLFQGRYRSSYINRDEYLLECGRYIERNPLRANIVDDITKYEFSSFNFYANSKNDDIITIDPLYGALNKGKMKRRRLYLEYILQPRAYEQIIDQKFRI